MRKIFLFMMVSTDGYFEGLDHDISWHNVDDAFNAFAINQIKNTGAILFGRRTYELMAGYWPSDETLQDDPVVARLMNKAEKYVFSHSMDKADWDHTTLVSANAAQFVRSLKKKLGKDLAIFGSNNLCVSLMQEGVVDEFRLMANPVALGAGTPLFDGIKAPKQLKLVSAQPFASGNVLLRYLPA